MRKIQNASAREREGERLRRNVGGTNPSLQTKKVAKFLLEFILVIILMSIALHLSALADTTNPGFLPVDNKTIDVYGKGSVPGAAEGIQGKSGQDILQQAVLGGLQYVKIIVVVISILMLTIMGYTLVTQGHNEEEVTKARRGIIFTVIAFVMISMAQGIAKVFDMSNGSIFGGPQDILNRVHLFDKQSEIFVTFVKYIIGSYCVLQIVRHGSRLITAGGNEEETGKRKKAIMFNAAGLLLVYLGDIAINKVFYKVDKTVYSGITGVHPSVDAKAGIEQIVGITNFIVTFVGPIGVLMLIVGAIMYATAGGQDEQLQKAKRILIASGIGLVIIFGAFAMVSTVLAGKLSDAGALSQ
ncbi:hypothetical protein HZA40_01290 [Candidatus Peregrinibacteria bacterium]|nr:hypothetical protein [Candidatus Peregrinibacteria bacterium]